MDKALRDFVTEACKVLDFEDYESEEHINAGNAVYARAKARMHPSTWEEFEDYAIDATDGEAIAWLIIRAIADAPPSTGCDNCRPSSIHHQEGANDHE